MATEGDSTPQASPRAGDGAAPSKRKGSALVIRTLRLEPTRRRIVDDSEAVKRRQELQALADAKQAELEEILMKLKEEKSKVVEEEGTKSGSSSDEDYDPLYDDVYADEEEIEQEPSNQRGLGARTLAASSPGTLEEYPTEVLHIGAQPYGKEKLTEFHKSRRAFEKEERLRRRRPIDDDSSEEEGERTPRRRLGKAKMVEAP